MSSNLNHMGNEGFQLMGAAFEVHNEQGGGLSEEIYQESLEVELQMQSIPFLSKSQITVFYKHKPLKTKYVPDLLVFGEIVVELKSVRTLLPEHEAQLLNYMRITKKAVGYLINLAPFDKVEWKRFILSQYIPRSD